MLPTHFYSAFRLKGHISTLNASGNTGRYEHAQAGCAWLPSRQTITNVTN